MELTYHGANCIAINSKKARLVIDDNLDKMGLKNVRKDGDILLFTDMSESISANDKKAKFIVNSPGEYEISNFSINGIPARLHTDEEGKNSIIYRIIANDVRIAVIGNIYPELSDNQLEAVGTVDILCLPVGGSGYTLDGVGAIELVRKVEPKIVVPVHYADPSIKYPVAQAGLETAVKAMSMEIADTQDSINPKGLETIANTRLVVLNRQ